MNENGKIFSPINIFRFFLTSLVVGISSFNLFLLSKSFKVTITTNRLNLVTQLLLIVLLIVNGIKGLKEENKVKRNSAYLSFVAAIVVLVLDTLTVIILFKSHGL
jgi:hypothetical protein